MGSGSGVGAKQQRPCTETRVARYAHGHVFKDSQQKHIGSHRHMVCYGLTCPMAGCLVLAHSVFACPLSVPHPPRRVNGQRIPAARHHGRQPANTQATHQHTTFRNHTYAPPAPTRQWPACSCCPPPTQAVTVDPHPPANTRVQHPHPTCPDASMASVFLLPATRGVRPKERPMNCTPSSDSTTCKHVRPCIRLTTWVRQDAKTVQLWNAQWQQGSTLRVCGLGCQVPATSGSKFSYSPPPPLRSPAVTAMPDRRSDDANA